MRTRVKRSVVWTMSDREFARLVKISTSISHICRSLSARKNGSMFSSIKQRIELMNLNTDHFVDKRLGDLNISYVTKEEFLNRLNVRGEMQSAFLKKKLIEFNLFPYKCNECSLGPVWNDKPLTLHLDHIDGDFTNNTLQNLRFLCPNCHTQTPTFSMGKRIRPKYNCSQCGCETKGNADRCISCGNKSRRKISRPTKEELEQLIKELPITKIALYFGVSDTAIRKWCKSMSIDCKVGRGYWS